MKVKPAMQCHLSKSSQKSNPKASDSKISWAACFTPASKGPVPILFGNFENRALRTWESRKRSGRRSGKEPNAILRDANAEIKDGMPWYV